LDVPLVQFSWNKELGMHTFIGEKPKEEKEKRKETALAGVAKTICSKQRYFTYVDLSEQIQSILDVKERIFLTNNTMTRKNYFMLIFAIAKK
jgi:hypothetical protein